MKNIEKRKVSSPAPLDRTATKEKQPEASKEFLEWKDMRLNNRVPLEATIESINKIFGKPDKIEAPNTDMSDVCVSFYDRDFQYAFYQNVKFEQYGDTLVFSSLNFRQDKRNYLQAGDLRLDASITLDKIKTLFPIAVKDMAQVVVHGKEEGGRDEDAGLFDVVQLDISANPTDDTWDLYFEDGKLVKVEYSMPC